MKKWQKQSPVILATWLEICRYVKKGALVVQKIAFWPSYKWLCKLTMHIIFKTLSPQWNMIMPASYSGNKKQKFPTSTFGVRFLIALKLCWLDIVEIWYTSDFFLRKKIENCGSFSSRFTIILYMVMVCHMKFKLCAQKFVDVTLNTCKPLYKGLHSLSITFQLCCEECL